MREYVWLECTTCGERNYRVQKETRGAEPARAEEVLPARAEAHAAQGVAQEVDAAIGGRLPADDRVRPVESRSSGSESGREFDRRAVPSRCDDSTG